MTTPADWALIKAHDILCPHLSYLSDAEKRTTGGPFTAQHLLAAYLEANEQPPVDPLLIEAREIAAQHHSKRAHQIEFLNGCEDNSYTIKTILAALRRGMELARQQTAENAPTTFTHCVDADGREIPVKFVEGPNKCGHYLWRVLGKHRTRRDGLMWCDHQNWWFNPNGSWPGSATIHLIRKGGAA